jgi:HTH-like domain
MTHYPQLASELGISDNTLSGCRHTAKADKSFTRQPQCSEQTLEIRRLKRKVIELEEDKFLGERIMVHHLASRKTYGVRRIRVDLQAGQRYCGKGRIAKLMKQLGIKSAATRQHKVTTDSNHRLPIIYHEINDRTAGI